MDENIKAGRTLKSDVDEGQAFETDILNKEQVIIRPDKVFGLTPIQIFIISLEIFFVVFFFGSIILFLSGKMAI
ncbi:MAG: hypothetical protein KAR20_06975 [Candidatus Heimdallarchaeota archaeon]|nr:hypothetical protein [Candidatus Heimdallarchaeota archaeon]